MQDIPGCRSPCPWYLRDSPPPTRAAACSFGALRVARGGSPDGFDEWCSTGPERVWEFAPSVQRWPAPAVILVTAERDATLRRQAAERGWGFLAKPVRAPALRALVSQTLLRLQQGMP